MTDDGTADDRNSDHAVRGSKSPAQQFYFACVLLTTEDVFCTPAPVFHLRKSAHIAAVLSASTIFKIFTPGGGRKNPE